VALLVAVGCIFFLSESITLRLLLASLLILGGIGLVIIERPSV